MACHGQQNIDGGQHQNITEKVNDRKSGALSVRQCTDDRIAAILHIAGTHLG